MTAYVETFAEALPSKERISEVRKQLARLALDEKAYPEALKFARMALHIDVLDAQTHRILGEAHQGMKNKEQAREEFKVAAELDPDDLQLQQLIERLE